MRGKIKTSASKVKRKKKIIRNAKIALITFILLLLVLYVVIGIIYSSGTFSISLDKNLYLERGIIVYDDPTYKAFRTELNAPSVDSFDNISYKWLPDDLDQYDGSHNGDNYVAYSFYIENMGDKVSDYWADMIIDDVIKGVDEAIRVRLYKNGEYVTYAKVSKTGNPEKDTVPFMSDTLIVREHVEDFKPGDINKYTVVLWVEGSDPECTDNILGGEIKIHMEFNSEFIEK